MRLRVVPLLAIPAAALHAGKLVEKGHSRTAIHRLGLTNNVENEACMGRTHPGQQLRNACRGRTVDDITEGKLADEATLPIACIARERLAQLLTRNPATDLGFAVNEAPGHSCRLGCVAGERREIEVQVRTDEVETDGRVGCWRIPLADVKRWAATNGAPDSVPLGVVRSREASIIAAPIPVAGWAGSRGQAEPSDEGGSADTLHGCGGKTSVVR